MKKRKKSGIIIPIIFVLLIVLGLLIAKKVMCKPQIVATINGVEMSEYTREYSYGEEINLSPKDILLEVTLDGESVTNELNYNDIEVDKCGEYEVSYYYDEFVFDYKFTVIDNEAPSIDVSDYIEVYVGDDLNLNELVIVSDNYDKQLEVSYSSSVDTSIVGIFEVLIDVVDQSGNQSSKTIQVEVIEDKDTIRVVDNPEDITVYISKTRYLPDGWSPSDLVGVGGNHQLRSEAADAYNKMMKQASNDGVNIILVSSYRTQEYQTNLYNKYVAKDPINAPLYSAVPRSSEHELGLAIDVSYDYSLHSDLDEYEVGKWMDEHAYEYGWIMSYPEGKTDITGYVFEPWHYRYVGVELASSLKIDGLTLEEYYN